MIKIVTKRIVNNGVLSRRIIDFSLLSRKELPSEYLRTPLYGDVAVFELSPGFFKIVEQKETQTYAVSEYHKGCVVSEAEFQKILFYCKCAGSRLRKINLTLREKDKDWCGRETFLI